MYGSELVIAFPSAEEKVEFMRWFEEYGFKDFTANTSTSISCLSSVEYGETGEEEESTSENGWIELE